MVIARIPDWIALSIGLGTLILYIYCFYFSSWEGSSTHWQPALWCRRTEQSGESWRWHREASQRSGRPWVQSHLPCEPSPLRDNEGAGGVLWDAGSSRHLCSLLLLGTRFPDSWKEKLPHSRGCETASTPRVQHLRGWRHWTDATEAIKSIYHSRLLPICDVS